MDQGKFCDGCSDADDCKMVYEQLGRADGPPIALKALLVFAVPVIVFAGALGGFGALLRDRVAPSYLTPLTFVLALLVTIAVVLGLSAIIKRSQKCR